jgi:FYVE zinc finger
MDPEAKPKSTKKKPSKSSNGTSSSLSDLSGSRPKLPRQPSTGDVHNDAILQAMTASEKKAKDNSNPITTTNIKSQLKSPPPGSIPATTATAATASASKTFSSPGVTKPASVKAGLKSPPPASLSSPSNNKKETSSKEKKKKNVTRDSTKIAQGTAAATAAAPLSSSTISSTSTAGMSTEKTGRITTPSTSTLAATGATSSTATASAEILPGAYSVQGNTVARATTGVLTSSKTSMMTEQIPSNQQSTSAIRSDDGTKTKSNKKKQSKKDLVVAAALTEDIEQMMERKIEEEVRKRIMAQAAMADVVSVDHGQRRQAAPEAEEAQRIADLKATYKPKGVREKLFGDKRQTVDIAASPECIRKRDYLQWTVKRNPTSGQWVASVMTNQKAMEDGNSLEAELTKASYSAVTQEEAYETGLANAVPHMQSFDNNPICYICKAKFALFRRPSHCRNCGVCICTNCTTTWPSRMFPATYVRKNDKTVLNVCIACDWVQNSFREALLMGNLRAADDLYATGNVK